MVLGLVCRRAALMATRKGEESKKKEVPRKWAMSAATISAWWCGARLVTRLKLEVVDRTRAQPAGLL